MKYDIVIIGAGIQGLIIARDILARCTDISLMVVDMKLPGLGATGYSAGYDIPGGRTALIKEMSEYSQEYYQQFLNDECGYYPVKTYIHSHSDAKLSYFNAGKYAEVSAPVEDNFLSHYLKTWQCSSCYRGDLHVITQQITRSLGDALEIIEGHFVESIDENDRGIHIKFAGGRLVQASYCIMCPGPWVNSPSFAKYTAPLNIEIKKIVAFHVAWPVSINSAAHYFTDDDAFLLPLLDKQYWLYSYTCQTWGVDPQGLLYVSASDIDTGKSILEKYSLTMSQLVHSGRAFCDAYSPHREPVVDYVNSNKSIVFAGASNGSGFRLAPAISKKVVELLNF
ncbi:Glycine/D-amino acid oxidase [Thalassolituus maritimus]|uniref:Glycine/D-amino acid oxidase n=1 Tax=Thalassolituus maritimus TaxID=484498 RepID=A0A1N7Q9D5_9GAMM|nr:FAD-dependent oxidoreductase [Thalassolituus maritimus]SIT19441.1 Glycine/D-amino acid oxidase [Thalassolituus maritimus]